MEKNQREEDGALHIKGNLSQHPPGPTRASPPRVPRRGPSPSAAEEGQLDQVKVMPKAIPRGRAVCFKSYIYFLVYLKLHS